MKPVYCTFCNTEIFHYVGPEDRLEFKAQHFQPASPNFKAPTPGQDIFCPHCAIKFIGASHQYNQIRMLIDSRYKGTGEVGTL